MYSSEKVQNLGQFLDSAHKILEGIKSHRYLSKNISNNILEIPSDLEHLRWFVLPSEAASFIQSRFTTFSSAVSPFYPTEYNNPQPVALPVITPLLGKKTKIVPNNVLYPNIPKKLIKQVLSAVNDFDMIHEGDKVIVCISGGKDSLTLLHLLRHIQKVSPKKFSIAAATVDPQTPEYNPLPLKSYMEELGVPYFYESHAIISLAAVKMTKKVSLCAFCSRMKRGILYSCARREGYNVLALGQHLDDLAESFFMSIFNNGLLRTMKANYVNDKGDLRIIRPLVYVRERLTKNFAEDAKLPVITENCPACFAAPTERHRTKLLLASQEQALPDVFSSILKAMKPIMRGEGLGEKRLRDEEDKEDDCEDCVFNPV